jgi:hypothetical protein
VGSALGGAMARASEVFSLLGKHQLVVHLDYGPALLGLEIRYSYPLSALHLSPERVIRIPQDQILRDVLRHLDHLVKGLTGRIPAPSGPPCQDRVCRPTGATIVIQDGRRGHEQPLAWLNYEDEGPEIGSRVGKSVRMTPPDFTPDEFSSWDRLRQRIRGIAWAHYQGAAADTFR